MEWWMALRTIPSQVRHWFFFLKILFPDFPKIFSGNIFPEHFEKKFPEFFRIFPEKIQKKSGP
jgi:hypothetical protein